MAGCLPSPPPTRWALSRGSAVALGAGIVGRSQAREGGLDTTASAFGAVLGLLAWLGKVVAFGGLAVLSSFLEPAR